MKTLTTSFAVLMCAWVAAGDQLVVTGQTKEGTFRGYENGRFEFENNRGRVIREQATRVMKLVMKAPQKVSFLTAGAKSEEKGVLKGYDKRNFNMVRDGVELLIPQGQMKTIEPVVEVAPGGFRGAVANRYPVPAVDVQALAGEHPTPDQKAAVDAFRAAKKQFDDYVVESSRLRQEMDQATGVKREALLNELRIRKNEEQPLRRALEAAYGELMQAFSGPADAGADTE